MSGYRDHWRSTLTLHESQKEVLKYLAVLTLTVTSSVIVRYLSIPKEDFVTDHFSDQMGR